MCGGAPVQLRVVMLFGTARDLADIIKRATFYVGRFRGFGPSKGQIRVSPIGNRYSPYTVFCTNVHTRDDQNKNIDVLAEYRN